MSEKTNTTIIDTSVLLDDSESIYNIVDDRIIIPFVVLEELEKKKDNMDEIGRNARRAIRIVDSLNGDISTGAKLENGSILQVLTTENGKNKTNDQKIIDLAIEVGKNDNVKILSQDVCMRVKAKALNIEAEAYGREKIKEKQIEEAKKLIYPGIGDIFISQEEIAEFFESGSICINKYRNDSEIYPNQFLRIADVYKNGSYEGIGIVKLEDGQIFLNQIKDYRKGRKKSSIRPKNVEQNLAMNLMFDPGIICTTMLGVAGTGKTLMALACALDLYTNNDNIKTIYLTKPQQPLDKSENQGYYPGDKDQKFEPWLGSFFDNLALICEDPEDIQDFREKGIIRTEPITLMRGRSIPNSIIIIDEFQNWNKKIAKTIMTRVGENTKIFACADIDQIDSPYLDYLDNGAVHCVEKFKNYDLIGHITLEKGERSPFATLSAKIL